MPFYWLSARCSLPSALPHAVPMVPKALIGYCKVWDRTPVRLSIHAAIGCDDTSVKYTLTARHAHRGVAPALIGYCTCQQTLIGQLAQLLVVHSPFCDCSGKRRPIVFYILV